MIQLTALGVLVTTKESFNFVMYRSSFVKTCEKFDTLSAGRTGLLSLFVIKVLIIAIFIINLK